MYSTAENITAQNTPTNKGYFGMAFRGKFPEIPPEEACSTSTDPLKQEIKVPRLYDVAIIEASEGKNCRNHFWTGEQRKGIQEVTVDDANNRMWTQGYEMSTSAPQSSTPLQNVTNMVDAQKWLVEEKIGRDYVIVVCQKKYLSTIPSSYGRRMLYNNCNKHHHIKQR